MIYFIEKDHKWFTSKQTWTKYYTEAVPFKTPEIAYAWAKDLNISGYIITEHELPGKIFSDEDHKHNIIEIAKVFGIPKEMMEMQVKPMYSKDVQSDIDEINALYVNRFIEFIYKNYAPKDSIFKRIKSFFTIISQKEINEAVGHGFKEYIR